LNKLRAIIATTLWRHLAQELLGQKQTFERQSMAKAKAGLQKVMVGKYVCPETDQLVPVSSVHPPPDLDCPLIIEQCPACGEQHEVSCDDLLEAEESDLR
jgi:hypothetical protein